MTERPLGVAIIGILQILGSSVLLAIALFFGINLITFVPHFSIIIIAVSALSLIFAIAFFTGQNWARILMMIGAVLDIISIIGIIWGIILLWYLTRHNVRMYFTQA